jgi:hypothetical protein
LSERLGATWELAGYHAQEEFQEILDTPEIKEKLEALCERIHNAWEDARGAE